MTEKKDARAYVKNIRKISDRDTILANSKLITEKLISLEIISKYDTLLLYNSINNEVDTKELMNYAKKCGKTLAFPTVVGDEMLFYRIDDDKDTKEGYMGIKEPIVFDDRLIECQNGVIIVPGVAFDKSCNRTGYGKGFYDKYLNKHTELIKIGLAFSFQIFDELKTDVYDIPLDYVITEESIYIRRQKYDRT